MKTTKKSLRPFCLMLMAFACLASTLAFLIERGAWSNTQLATLITNPQGIYYLSGCFLFFGFWILQLER